VSWDWKTQEPYYFIFSCLMAFAVGITWRVLINFIKFQVELTLMTVNNKSNEQA